MSKLAILATSIALSLSACAATGTTLSHDETAPHARVQLDLSSPSRDAILTQRRAIDPELPSADRIAHQIRARLGDHVTAELELCIGATGTVHRVALVRGTSLPKLDEAILRDATAWQFASLPGKTASTSLQTCQRATLAYRVR
ncbi:MAG TPA: hypothetical protein VFQ53_38805 [Kofleriaceae bacterium]|nr:hypothetical protein [Kofleriaceae bacterium]